MGLVGAAAVSRSDPKSKIVSHQSSILGGVLAVNIPVEVGLFRKTPTEVSAPLGDLRSSIHHQRSPWRLCAGLSFSGGEVKAGSRVTHLSRHSAGGITEEALHGWTVHARIHSGECSHVIPGPKERRLPPLGLGGGLQFRPSCGLPVSMGPRQHRQLGRDRFGWGFHRDDIRGGRVASPHQGDEFLVAHEFESAVVVLDDCC